MQPNEMMMKRNLTISVPIDNKPEIIPIEDNDSDGEEGCNTLEENELLQAAKDGNLQRVKDLISQGVNRECSDEYGNTPLMLAAGEGHSEVVKFLIRNHASLLPQNHDNWTALEMAVANGEIWDEYTGRSEDGSDDHPAVVEILMQALKNNKEAWDEYTEDDVWGEAIGIAAQRGNDESLKALLKHLNLYTQGIKDEAERVIFEQGYLDYANGDGDTPLMLTAHSRQAKDGVKILIEAGACYERVNNEDWDVICCAAAGGTLPVFMFLIDTIKKDQEYFKHYCEQGRLGMALLAASELHDSSDHNLDDIESARKMAYLLLITCEESDQNAARHLVLKYTDEDQNTALHLAATCGKFFTSMCLVIVGVSWSNQNNEGKTALDLAREFTVPDSDPENEALTTGKQTIIALLECLTMSMMPQAETAPLLSLPALGAQPPSAPELSTPEPEDVPSSSSPTLSVPEEQPKALLEQFKNSRKRTRNQRDQNGISNQDERPEKISKEKGPYNAQ